MQGEKVGKSGYITGCTASDKVAALLLRTRRKFGDRLTKLMIAIYDVIASVVKYDVIARLVKYDENHCDCVC